MAQQRPDIDNIPLPDQLPSMLDVSTLPKDILHTSTVETLLNQNQDLMTRLSINIRRVTDLEIALRNSEEKKRMLESQKEALKEEFEVVSEKFRIIKTSTEKNDSEKSILEKRFAELQTRSQDIHERLLEENYYFRGLLFILHNYHRRVKKYVKPALKKQRNQIEQAQSRIEVIEKEAKDFERWAMGEITNLSLKIERFKKYRRRIRTVAKPRIMALNDALKTHEIAKVSREHLISTQEKQIDQLNNRLNEQIENFEGDQSRLVNYHEERYRLVEESHIEATQKVKNLLQEVRMLEERCEELTEKGSIFENRAIRAERTSEEVGKKRNSELTSYEEKIKTLESLIVQNSNELEELRMKDSAAQALNRRLSQDMTELRKENEQLRQRVRASKIVQPPAPPPAPVIVQAQGDTPDLRRLEKIFAEIQSGHSGAEDFI